MVSVGLQYRPNVVSKELAGDFLIVMSKKSIEFWDASQGHSPEMSTTP